jgi:nitroreductase
MLADLIRKNRSYRRYNQSESINTQILLDLVELARLSPCGRNIQSLKYILINSPDQNEKVFNTLGWAGYFKDWKGPEDGERPSAYIIILLDKFISSSPGIDHGIAAQSILLGAVEKGLGGCMIATIRREELGTFLNISDQFEILLVLALGTPVEKVIIEELSENGDIKYWRDENRGHHVPKRALKDIVIPMKH